MFSARITILRFGVAVILCCIALQGLRAMAGEVLRNQDVLKMVSAGLSEEVIIAKIREEVEFQVSIDDLVALRKAQVSDRVVGAMLERTKSLPKKPARSVGVSLKTVDGVLPLRLATGAVSSVGFGWTSNTFMNYPGLESRVRTHDKHPSLLIACPSAPEVGHYFLAKLDRDKRRGTRSLKIGQAIRRMGTPGGRLAPDSKWVVPFEVQDEGQETWRVTLNGDLQPGEYGWYVNLPDSDNPLAYIHDTCFMEVGFLTSESTEARKEDCPLAPSVINFT